MGNMVIHCLHGSKIRSIALIELLYAAASRWLAWISIQTGSSSKLLVC